MSKKHKPYSFFTNFNEKNSVDKKYMAYIIRKDLNKIISPKDCLSIVYLLVDEIKEFVISGGELNVPNLGILKLKKLKSRKNADINTGLIIEKRSVKILKFNIDKKLSDYLISKLDRKKTFPE